MDTFAMHMPYFHALAGFPSLGTYVLCPYRVITTDRSTSHALQNLSFHALFGILRGNSAV